jgi:hypothetical protein
MIGKRVAARFAVLVAAPDGVLLTRVGMQTQCECGDSVSAHEFRGFQSLETPARHSGEGRNPVKYVVRSTQKPYVECYARHS